MATPSDRFRLANRVRSTAGELVRSSRATKATSETMETAKATRTAMSSNQ